MASFKSLYNQTKNVRVAEKVVMATSFLARLKGLLGTSSLPQGEGLFLKPCQSIHMVGMVYAIDAVFVDHDLKVVGLVEGIKPFMVSKHFKKANACLEIPCGTIKKAGIENGDQLVFEDKQTN